MESILGFLPSFRSSVIDDAGLSSSFSSLVSSILYSGRDVRRESLAAFLSSLPAAGKADSDDQAIEEAVLYISDRGSSCCHRMDRPVSLHQVLLLLYGPYACQIQIDVHRKESRWIGIPQKAILRLLSR